MVDTTFVVKRLLLCNVQLAMIGFDGKTVFGKLPNMNSLDDFLRSVPYFSTLGPEEIKRIAKETFERSFAKGEVLFLEGEPCRGLYVVKSGRVRIFKISPEGS